MRTILFSLLVCFGCHVYAQSTMPMPFLQPYDSYDYNNKPDYHRLEVNYPPFDSIPKYSFPIPDVIAAQGVTWDLFTRTGEPERGKALKLTVDDSSFVTVPSPPDDEGRRRAETLYKLPNLEGQTSYIQWSFLIPNNVEFQDQDTISTSYHKIFQVLPSTADENGNQYVTGYSYPFVGVEYIHKYPPPLLPSRDLFFRIRSPNDPNRHFRLTVTDAIDKGTWNTVTYKTTWSNDDTAENVRIWINGLPVVLTSTPPTAPNYTATMELGASGTNPYAIECATIGIQADNNDPNPGIGILNNIKFGHYRRDHSGSHSIYIDDFEVSNFDPFNEPNPIKLVSGNCNVAIPIDNQNITCETITGTSNYKFRFEQGGNYYWVNNGNSPTVNLLNHSFIEPATTYSVQVRAQGSNFDINYGDICSITIPHLTKLRSADCNVMNSNQFNGIIGALTVNNATNYKFRFKHPVTQNYFYGNSSTHTITPSSINGLEPGVNYEVHVRAQSITFDFDYGDPCNLHFKADKLTESNNSVEKSFEPHITPNPFSEEITLHGFSDTSAVKILDRSGNILFSKKQLNGNTLNLGFLQKGLYFMEIESKGLIHMIKLVKQ